MNGGVEKLGKLVHNGRIGVSRVGIDGPEISRSEAVVGGGVGWGGELVLPRVRVVGADDWNWGRSEMFARSKRQGPAWRAVGWKCRPFVSDARNLNRLSVSVHSYRARPSFLRRNDVCDVVFNVVGHSRSVLPFERFSTSRGGSSVIVGPVNVSSGRDCVLSNFCKNACGWRQS